jgi:glycosyltransferase involved in cell wall biosynthesis
MTRPSRPLAIAHVTGETGFSGGEVQVFLLMEGLRARGHRCGLVCPRDSRSATEAGVRGFETWEVPMRSSASPLAIWRVAAALRECAPDLVHLHTGRANWIGSLAAHRLGLPAITTRRMDREVKRGPRTRWLYGRGVRRAVAISAAVERCLLDGGVPKEMIRVIHSAVDASALRPSRERDELRREAGLTDDAVCILALVSLVRRKGLDVLLEAISRLEAKRSAVFWIAGEGPERDALERRSRELGLEQRVRFLGRREDRADLLAACDALVLPSRLEGLGVAALEAMACGRAVVASRVGGLAESVVDDVTGLLVPPADATALAGALERIVSDAALRQRLGAAGPGRIAESYGAEQMTEAYERVYADVLARPSA